MARLRKVCEFSRNAGAMVYRAAVIKNAEWGEYQVKFFRDDVHLQGADYHTGDLDDAKETAAAEVDRLVLSCAEVERSHQDALALIYRHTHRDYKGKRGGIKSIMVCRGGGSCLVPLDGLTEAEVADRLPRAMKKEAERLEAKKKAAQVVE